MPDQTDHFGGTLTFPTWTPNGFIWEGKEDGVIFDMGTITLPTVFGSMHPEYRSPNDQPNLASQDS